MRNFQLFVTVYCISVISCKYITRDTEYGKVRGFVTKRGTNIEVEQYLGVPYAAPPIGNLRFESPVHHIPWNKTLDTLNVPPACLQKDFGYIGIHVPGFNRSSEDCLYLNVYVPHQLRNKAPLSVLLYVHGGSNIAGMGAMFSGDLLAGYGNIIVVTFNYRLGAYGFIAAKQEGLDGNYGFLDQVKVMKWVKSNIRFFGGDPAAVTIYGHSAGAIDVALHTVSPLSKGLFRYAIVHSASPLSYLTMIHPDWTPGYNVKIDSIWNLCPKKSNISLKKCLKNLAIDKINSIKGKPKIGELIIFDFPVVVDGNFLTKRPEESFETGNFSGESFLFSFTKDEMALMISGRMKKVELEYSLRRTLHHYQKAYVGVCSLSDLIFLEYDIQNVSLNYISSVQKYIEIESDFHFVAPIIRMANLITNWTENIYVTRCDQQRENTFMADLLGIGHGLDMFYVFGNPLVGHSFLKFTSEDIKISKLMMKLYSNFVKYGFLTLDGKTKYSIYNSSSKIVNSLGLKNDTLFVTEIHNFKLRKMNFWNNYLPKIHREAKTPYCNACSGRICFKVWVMHVIWLCLFLKT